eukprot:g2068.t1
MVYKLLLILVIQCGGNFETIYGQQYEKKTSGKCQYDITCFNECEAAAIALGFSDTSATDDKQDNGQTGVTYDPKGCYYEGGSLKFNARMGNTGSCSSSDQCLCKTSPSPTCTLKCKLPTQYDYVKKLYEDCDSDDTGSYIITKAECEKAANALNLKSRNYGWSAKIDGGYSTSWYVEKKLLRKQRMAIISLTLKTRKAMVQRGEGYGLYYRRQAKQDPGVHRLRASNDEVIAEAKDVTPRSRNTWDMTAIELSGVGKTQRNKKVKKGMRGDMKVKGGFQLNPIRTSAIGFAVEERLPPVKRKNAKVNRRSVLTVENNEEWVEYVDENTKEIYYHNVTSDVVQWNAPNVLFKKV